MRKKLFVVLLVIAVVAFCGCEDYYTESELESARQQGYNEGFNTGYTRGLKDQREKDCNEFLIDGRSIRNIEEQVYDKYGVTPSQAFGIVDEYEYDSSHGGFTWDEYQNAIEAIYYTASIFPQTY